MIMLAQTMWPEGLLVGSAVDYNSNEQPPPKERKTLEENNLLAL